MSLGDIFIGAGAVSGVISALLLLIDIYAGRTGDGTSSIPASIRTVERWMIGAFAFSLSAAFLLLSYAFVISDFTFLYVWQFSSVYYPFYYKLAGSLAGQQGTMLFWAALISIGALWLGKGKESQTAFVKKSQLLTVVLGLFFTYMTIMDSPFTTIYQTYPDLQDTFIPEDGNGMNPLLLDPWMISHPFTTFLGYAGTTVPFAAAVVYLISTLRGARSTEEAWTAQKLWVTKGLLWMRVSWFFLTLSMAFGGIWAYKTLGWGGFWGWDPVETAMLMPWLMLTAAIHVVIEHRRDRTKYNILAPVLVAFSFSMVVYATAVTRSGVFESVHSFISGDVGRYILTLLFVSFLIPLVLGIMKYLMADIRERKDVSIINRTNIFYSAIIVFLIINLITFFGVTFPPIIKLITTNKYAVTKQFFNIWLYPFFILMLLLIGLGLQYTPSKKKDAVASFLFFAFLTLIMALIKPNQDYNIVDYTSFISAEKPFLYETIGEISSLSVIPPVLYILYSSLVRFRTRAVRIGETGGREYNAREIGVILIHLGVVFISVGIVFSSLFTTEFSVTFDKGDIGSVKVLSPALFHEGFGKLGTWGVHAGEGESEYRVVLLDYREYVDYGSAKPRIEPERRWMTIGEFLDILEGVRSGRTGIESLESLYLIRGRVAEVIGTAHATYIRLRDGNNELWVATGPGVEVPEGADVVVEGEQPYLNFGSTSLNRTFDVLLMARGIEGYEHDYAKPVFRSVQQAKVAIYKGDSKLGEGYVKYEIYKNGDARRPLIDRSLLRDVFVIFDGGAGGSIPLTVRLKPLINEIWLGVILFIVGISICIFTDKGTRKDLKNDAM